MKLFFSRLSVALLAAFAVSTTPLTAAHAQLHGSAAESLSSSDWFPATGSTLTTGNLDYTVGPLPKAYLGAVATKGKYPDFYNPSYTTVMARSTHVASQALSRFKIVLSHGYVDPHDGEHIPAGSVRYTASVEYPAGVFRRVTFNGANSVSRTDGGLSTSDDITLAIPSGAIFWVRLHEDNPSGVFFAYIGNTYAPYDQAALGDNNGPIPDLTAGGTITGITAQTALSPVAIIGQTAKTSTCLVGDSRVVGLDDQRNDATGDGGELARYVGPRSAYINLAVSAGITGAFLTANTNRVALLHYCSLVIDELGINNVGTDPSSPGSIVADRTRIAKLAPWARVLGTTMAPYTSSTDSYATTANQHTQGIEANRIATNNLIRAGLDGESNYIDIDKMIDPNATGLWPVNGTANWATGDGVHERAPATHIEAISPEWQRINLGR